MIYKKYLTVCFRMFFRKTNSKVCRTGYIYIWKYTIPYGLIYAMEPSKELLQFLVAIGEADSNER